MNNSVETCSHGALSGGAVTELVRFLLRPFDQLFNGPDAQLRPRNQDTDIDRIHAERREILDLVASFPVDCGSHAERGIAGRKHGIAIGLAARDLLAGDAAAGAGLVDDHKSGVVEHPLERLNRNARRRVGRTSRRERDYELDRCARPSRLRLQQ